MSERKARLTVTIDPHLAAYAEGLVQAGKAPSVSAVVNGALEAEIEHDRRIRRRWNEVLSTATEDDKARAARMLARAEAQMASLPDSHRFR